MSKAITDYINLGEDYEKVRKVYSINIVYFTLGQAKDYVYHGKTVFQGLHDPHDILKLSNRQSEVFFGDTFEKDEKSQREAGDTAPGLADAKECLDVRKLSREELLVYQRHKMNEAYQRSVISTGYDDGMQDGIKKGRAEGRVEGIAEGKAEGMVEVAKKMLMARLPDAQIIAFTGLTQEQINRLKN